MDDLPGRRMHGLFVNTRLFRSSFCLGELGIGETPQISHKL